MKTIIRKLALCALLGASTGAYAAPVLIPNGDFSIPGGANWSNFASGGTVISFPTTGGNTGGYGIVDNTAGAWGGGLVAPADFEYPGNTGIPLATLGLVAGQTYTFTMDMINLVGTDVGGVKFESWGAAIISNSGDVPATGQSSSWATYSWNYTIAPTATSIKVVPLLTGPTYAPGTGKSSIGFDNIKVNNTPVPPPPFVPDQIPNGDFEATPLGVNWATTETTPTYLTTGGNPGNFVQLSDGVGPFSVLYAFNGAEKTFASLGLSPGDTYSIQVDMKLITAGIDPTSPIGGVILVGPAAYSEPRFAPAIIGTPGEWATYTFDFTVPAVIDPPTPEQIRIGIRPGKSLSGNTVAFDNVFIVLPTPAPAPQPSILIGKSLNWTPTVPANFYQPQESANGSVYTNLGSSIIGTSVSSVFDPTPAPFYRVQESAPSFEEVVYNGGFEDTFLLGWMLGGTQPPVEDGTDTHTGANAIRILATATDVDPGPGVAIQAGVSILEQNTTNSTLDNGFGGEPFVTAGNTYDFSFWFKQISGTDGYVQGYKLAWLDDGGIEVVTPIEGNFSGAIGVWEQKTVNGLLAPAGATSALILIQGSSGAFISEVFGPSSGEVLIDDVSLLGSVPGTPSTIASSTASTAEISWQSAAGQTYQLRSSTDLSGWAPFGGTINGNGSIQKAYDTPLVTKKFYQLGTE